MHLQGLAVIGCPSVCLSVDQMCELWQNETNLCRHFYTIWVDWWFSESVIPTRNGTFYFDSEMNLQSCILDIGSLDERKTGEVLGKAVEDVVREFGLDYRKVAIVTDNASKRYYDAKVWPILYAEGDRVYYFNPRKRTDRSKQWARKYSSHTIVKIRTPVAVPIQHSRNSKAFVTHIDKIKPCYEEEGNARKTDSGSQVLPPTWASDEIKMGWRRSQRVLCPPNSQEKSCFIRVLRFVRSIVRWGRQRTDCRMFGRHLSVKYWTWPSNATSAICWKLSPMILMKVCYVEMSKLRPRQRVFQHARKSRHTKWLPPRLTPARTPHRTCRPQDSRAWSTLTSLLLPPHSIVTLSSCWRDFRA